MAGRIPANLLCLHTGEEELRAKALTLIEADARLTLHLDITEHVMDLFDILRKFPTEDEDLKVIQVLGIRTFNAFASAIKLMLSGYSQKSALIMRDILECTFLVDLFRTDRSAISRWRAADKQARLKEFKPIKVRKALDAPDGFTTKKRTAMYDLFSELAGHPSMLSIAMLRPNGMDAHCGPFLDPKALEAVLSELGRLAVQAGEIFGTFVPEGWKPGIQTRLVFDAQKRAWLREFLFGHLNGRPPVTARPAGSLLAAQRPAAFAL
jgi:hypothetical protein